MEAGEILLRKGLLNEEQLKQAQRAKSDDKRLDQAAVELGLVSEEEALRALGEELGIEFVDLVDAQVDEKLISKFPVKFIYRENLFPLREENGAIVVATSDPFNLYPLDELSTTLGKSVQPVLAARAEIDKLIKRHFGVGSDTIDQLIAQSEDEDVEILGEMESDGSELSQLAQEPSVVRLVNEILWEAVELRASDVHIESQPSG
ncbi:MAG: type II/IV secretion system protein, partial [Planctomycetota bacterium]